MSRYHFKPQDIWTMDETVITTVQIKWLLGMANK